MPAHEKVCEFIENLNSFATGDYLGEEEKRFWEQPFDPAVLPELALLIRGYVDSITGPLTAEDTRASILGFYHRLDEFNRRYGYAVIEPEEMEEINDIILTAWNAHGDLLSLIGKLPELEDEAEPRP